MNKLVLVANTFTVSTHALESFVIDTVESHAQGLQFSNS